MHWGEKVVLQLENMILSYRSCSLQGLFCISGVQGFTSDLSPRPQKGVRHLMGDFYSVSNDVKHIFNDYMRIYSYINGT